MDDLLVFLNEVKKLFGENEIEIKHREDTNIELNVPDKLKEFYQNYEKIDTPFGYIYDLQNALEASECEPFKSSGWFCFGQDNYGFVFWLCRYDSKQEEASFVEWDHDMDTEIEDAIDDSLTEFLKRIEEDFEENTQCSITIEHCEDNALDELMKVKKTLNLQLSMSELKDITNHLPYEITDDFLYVEVLKKVRALHLSKVVLKLNA